MENSQSDHPRVQRVIVEVATGAVERLSAPANRVETDKRASAQDDEALARRVIAAIAMSETILSNCRAALSRPCDIEDAEEAAMLRRARRMLTRVLDDKWPRPPPSEPN